MTKHTKLNTNTHFFVKFELFWWDLNDKTHKAKY